ncbi:MAG: hypothetical protein ACTSPK_00120 [Candidatus Heimdallarchaeota archaeon]
MIDEEPEIPETKREREKKYHMGGGRKHGRVIEKGHTKAEGTLGTSMQSALLPNLTLGTEELAASYQIVTLGTVTGKTLLSVSTLAAQDYKFKLNSVEYTITATASMVYGDIIPLMNAEIPAEFRWIMYDNNLRCFKSSTTDLIVAVGDTVDLFAGLDASFSIETVVTATAITLGSTIPTFCTHYHLEGSATTKHHIRDVFGCMATKLGLKCELEDEVKQSFDYIAGKSITSTEEVVQPSEIAQETFKWSDVKLIVISDGTHSVELKNVSDSWEFEMLNDCDVKKSQGNLFATRNYIGGFDGNFKLNLEPYHTIVSDATSIELFEALFEDFADHVYEVDIFMYKTATTFYHISIDRMYIDANPFTIPFIDGDTKGVVIGEASFEFGDDVTPTIMVGSGIVSTVPPLPTS